MTAHPGSARGDGEAVITTAPTITPGQLAAARGCDYDNPCWWDCEEAAADALEGWDQVDAAEQEWIRAVAANLSVPGGMVSP